MAEFIIWTTLERVLTMSLVCVAFIGALKYLINAKNKENKSERMLLLGFTILLVSFGIGMLMLFVSGFYHQGTLENGIFTGIYDHDLSPVKEFRLVKHVTVYGGYLGFTFQFERSQRKTRYLLSITYLIFYIDYLIEYVFGLGLLAYQFVIFMLIFFLTMIWLLIQSDLEFQNLALIFLMGFGTTASLGVFSNPYRLQEASLTIPVELIMLLLLIATIIITLPAFIDLEHFITLNPKPIFYSTLLVMIFIMSLQFFLFFISYGSEEFIMTIILMIIIFSTTILVYRRNMTYLRESAESPVNQGSQEKPQILTAFSKPKKVLEEEVTISKEKKICIVCKGKVGRNNVYLCPGCDTFYCKKCSVTLVTLENACWVCDTPIDETKPVIRPKQEEKDEITIEETTHK